MSIKGCLRAGSFSFFDRCSCFGLTLAESYASSHMALHLWASMDALVVSRSLRALLAFVWSSIMSSRRLMLLVLEMAAIGEMLAGMSSREASTSSILT